MTPDQKGGAVLVAIAITLGIVIVLLARWSNRR